MRAFVLAVPRAESEIASDRLWCSGAPAVEERDTLDPDIVELWTVFGDDPDVSRIVDGAQSSAWTARVVDLDDSVADTWRCHVTPIPIDDDLVVVPAWLPDPQTSEGFVVHIDPGASFGLGDHPTTMLTLRALRSLVVPGSRVLDVGCGSGVLAITALLLGAAGATAIDISPAAIDATLANANLNGVTERLEASTADLSSIEGTFDIVVANILAPTLIDLAPDLKRCTTGTLVISGILDGAHDHVLQALRPLQVVETTMLDGWAAVMMCPPN